MSRPVAETNGCCSTSTTSGRVFAADFCLCSELPAGAAFVPPDFGGGSAPADGVCTVRSVQNVNVNMIPSRTVSLPKQCVGHIPESSRSCGSKRHVVQSGVSCDDRPVLRQRPL